MKTLKRPARAVRLCNCLCDGLWFLPRLFLVGRLAWVYWRRAAPLVQERPAFEATAPPPAFPSLRVQTLSRASTQRLLDTARREGVTVNDWLLAAAARAASAFRRDRNATPELPIRLSIPINLRTEAETNDATLAAANIVSMVFLDRCVSETTSPRQLARSIHRAMVWAKRLRDAATLLCGLRLLKFFPRLLPHVVQSRNRCWATVVVSNAGRLFTTSSLPRSEHGEIIVGDAVLQQVDVAPPIRGWTAAAIGIATYASAMTFTLHYDSGRMTPADADDFLSHFVANATEASLAPREVLDRRVE